MPVPNQPFKAGWTVHEKKGAGQFGKYDTIHAVIIGATKKGSPSSIYFSDKAYAEMGKPKFIEVRHNGTDVGFFPLTGEEAAENSNAYTVQYSGEYGEDKDRGEGRAMITARTVIAEYKLQSGVYSASVYIDGSTHVITINSNDRPSKP